MSEESQPRFWLERSVQEIAEARPEGELIIESGASPSGTYHVGHLREFLTADAIAWGLRQIGRQARHIHFVDDIDRFRKVPANVPADFEQYLGRPLNLVPAPDGSDKNFAEFFFGQIHDALLQMGAEMEVIYAHDEYNAGKFADDIVTALVSMDDIREIIERVSGRQLSSRWAPVQLRDDDDSYDSRWFTGFNAEAKTVSYEAKDGSTGEMTLDSGRVKLDWRIDWPARWAKLGVAVEPFGRDHATKGGSYDTGKELVEKVYNAPAPIAVPYEFINIKGQSKKMSASSGDGILPLDALQVMPPQVLKNFILGSRPSLQLFIDMGPGFGRMFELFAEAENAASEAPINPIKLAKSDEVDKVVPDLPFNHMVVAWQSGRKNADAALDILRRSEHAGTVETQEQLIRSMFPYIEAWLEKWAPETVKFTVQDSLPDVELTDQQTALLTDLAKRIEGGPDGADGEWYHVQVHEAREAAGLEPKQAFQALYRVLLDKDSGPKAGWFLSTFEAEWLAERFSQASQR